jgi:23S rRNA (cytidine2498-2'-O)-methyltransferase
LLVTREGSEPDLLAELELALPAVKARVAVPGIVLADRVPCHDDGDLALSFARQAFVAQGSARGEIRELSRVVAGDLRDRLSRLGEGVSWSLLGFVPDTEEGNRFSSRLGELERALLEELRSGDAGQLESFQPLGSPGARPTVLVHLALVRPDRVHFGIERAAAAFSRFAGGRARMKVAPGAPSRAVRKLAEALAWLGISPAPGELCVDLGAAPGGWTHLALRRRAKVVAVDPGRMHPDLAGHPSLQQIRGSAFDYEPAEPVDWLLCDMAFRPLDVARLLGKWGRRGWARLLVANFKLPMTRKAEIVAEIRSLIEAGGWQRVRTRQLYHDREEITLVAHR